MRGRPKVAYYEDEVPDDDFRDGTVVLSHDEASPVMAITYPRERQRTKEDRTPADKPQG